MTQRHKHSRPLPLHDDSVDKPNLEVVPLAGRVRSDLNKGMLNPDLSLEEPAAAAAKVKTLKTSIDVEGGAHE